MTRDLHIILRRRIIKRHITQGDMTVNGIRLGNTCESAGWDKDKGGRIIPEGEYQVVISRSKFYERSMPEVVGVEGFDDVRIHGCELMPPRDGDILLGQTLTPDGVRCPDVVNKMLVSMIGETIQNDGRVYLEVVI